MPIEIISGILIFVQIAFSLYKRHWGISAFLFIFIVFPQRMPFLNFFDLGLVKTSTIIALLFNFRMNGKSKLRYYQTLFILSLLLIPSFILCKYSSSLYYYTFFFFINTFLPGIIIYKYVRDTYDLETIYFSVFLGLFFMCIFGITELITNNNLLVNALKSYSDNIKVFEYVSDYQQRFGFVRRVQSTAWHPIAYGGYIALFLPLMMYPLFTKPFHIKSNAFLNNSLKTFTNKKKFFLLAFLSLLAFNLFLCLSRSAWVSGTLALVTIIFLQRNYVLNKKHEINFIRLVLLIPFLGFGIYLIIDFFSHTHIEGSSINMRVDQANYIYKIIKNDILLGLGDGATGKLMASGLNEQALGFESILFAYPVNYGLLGSLGYVFMYISTYVFMLKPQKTQFTTYFKATIFAHLAFIILTGEMETTQTFWLLFSFYYAAHLNELDLRKLINKKVTI